MKFSVSWVACVGVAFMLSLAGCVDTNQKPATVPQKKSSGYSVPYKPYYQGTNPAPGSEQTTVISRAPTLPVVPMPSVSQNAQSQVKVAILLPLSGKNAALGQAMLNAAQQAVFDAASTNFELQPHDTAAEGAEGAARAAIIGGAQLIIGPLFATDVPSVTLVAQVSGIQILPLSTDTTLAQRGVYVMGLAPGAQVERVVAYAIAHGARHFASLTPASPYGVLVSQVFHDAVLKNGGQLVDMESYDPAGHDLDARVKTLAGQRMNIDALFLPESGGDLKIVADQLTAAGFDGVHTHILGTGLWDVPGLGHQSPLLIGGWYAAPDPALRRTFIAGYTAAYGQEPPRLATLAYDATALAAVLAKHGARYDDAALTNPNGFAGLDGIFRLLSSGVVERALAVDEVTVDGAKTVDAAPTSFVTSPH